MKSGERVEQLGPAYFDSFQMRLHRATQLSFWDGRHHSFSLDNNIGISLSLLGVRSLPPRSLLP